jgi:hypothetical protein
MGHEKGRKQISGQEVKRGEKRNIKRREAILVSIP